VIYCGPYIKGPEDKPGSSRLASQPSEKDWTRR